MHKRILPIFLLALALTGETMTEHSATMMAYLLNLLFALMTVVVPMLLIYAFLKSTLDVLKTRCLKIAPIALIGATTLDQVMSAMMSLMFIIIPFTLVLLLWKAFIKLIKV